MSRGEIFDQPQLGALATDVLRGLSVSAGVGRGTAYVLACAGSSASPRRDISADEIAGEIARFQVALETADRELQALKREVSERIGPSEAEIFAAQALMLGDAAFRGQVSNMIRERRVNAEAALADVIEKFSHAFDEIRDAYLKERAADVRDMGYRVLAALIEETQTEPFEIPEGSIIVAEELSPSLTARLELGRVRGIVTGHGSRFSHTAILARSQGVPAVSAVAHAAVGIKTGDQVVVDGFSGVVFVNPEESVEREYDRLESEIRAGKERLRDLVPLPSVTLEGELIRLSANVSKIADTESALLHNADGIGLYRTEFGYAIRDRFPTEEEQYELLERAAARVHPRPVAFRLLDVGADKALTYFPLPAARNPSLAERGIRLLLRHPLLLKRQLRAFLRVSASHPISILLPMVVSVEDVRRTRRVIEEAKAELAAEGLAFDAEVPVGAMIEVPAAAFSVHALAREADFFSLGTNDLVQYMLAADREDENVAEYYDPAHPAVLRLIRDLAEGARAAGRSLTICGDMAADPRYTELLLGLGLRGFSVAPGAILDVKERIRNTSLPRAVRLAHELLELGSAEAISARLGQNR